MTLTTPAVSTHDVANFAASGNARADRSLHDGWNAVAVGGPIPAEFRDRAIPATVPGSIHTDLLAAGLIVDPYLDDHERLLAWIGACDWRYSTTFDWTADDATNTELVFDGLDTIATIELNGAPVGTTANMHRTYRFDVRTLLIEGRNELSITFESALRYADRASLEQGYRPHVNHHPYNSIRKMACSFGWDWGPDTATAGIWRRVRLSSWSVSRLVAVRPTATIEGDLGVVDVVVELVPVGVSTRLDVRAGDVSHTVDVAAGQSSARLSVSIDDPELWWPRGHGEQPLYRVEVVLSAKSGTIDTWSGRIGFRTVRIDHLPDADGTPFTFVINDRPVFIRGANWIPDDAFPHRVDRARYAHRIDQAEFANINLLRVWGGGIYEADDFFDLCDERGILTWQDFLFACAAYTEDEPMRSEVEAEARDNITRLMPHPSLVVWNGNNENIWGFQEWGWEKRLGGRSWGLGYYLDLLPSLVDELDPSRPYTPGSPFSPAPPEGVEDFYPNDPAHGSVHIWDLWNQRDYPDYRTYEPRFVGEFGWQGPPTWSTLTRSISDSPLTPESPGMLIHQKAMDGNVKLIDGLVAHLPLPDDMEDWHWAMSLNQATAIGVGIEHFRSLSPLCMGLIVWQLNDCWPVTSWAAVDGDGREKPLLYAIKHAYADRLLTVQPRDAGLRVAAVNDHAQAWTGDLVVRRRRFDGTTVASVTIAVEIAPRSTYIVAVDATVGAPDDAAGELIEVRLGESRTFWFFTDYRDSHLGRPQLTASVESVSDGYAVTVTAATLARDVTLLVDKLDPHARVDDQLVTLLPGEGVTFLVRSNAELLRADWTARGVLRSANQLLFPEGVDALDGSQAL